MSKTSPVVRAALAVMDQHITALNTHDEEALAQTLHFPHVRLSSAGLKIWPMASSYFEDFRARAGGSWHHSAFNDIQILAESAEKVHLDAEIIRFNAQKTVLTRFRSLWVITFEEGRWAAKMRSSFAAV